MVEEPTLEQTIEILKGIRERYEQHHKVTITDEAVKAAADLSVRYITDRHLPDKAIDLIDEAASRGPPPLCLGTARPRARRSASWSEVTKEKDAAINAQEYEEAAELREAEATPEGAVETLRTEWQTKVTAEQPTVGEEEIAQVVAMWTGIPVTRIAQEESERLLQMEEAAPQAGHRPAGGDRHRLEGGPPGPGRAQGSQAADRLVHLPRPHRRRARRSWPRPSPSSCSAARTP